MKKGSNALTVNRKYDNTQQTTPFHCPALLMSWSNISQISPFWGYCTRDENRCYLICLFALIHVTSLSSLINELLRVRTKPFICRLPSTRYNSQSAINRCPTNQFHQPATQSASRVSIHRIARLVESVITTPISFDPSSLPNDSSSGTTSHGPYKDLLALKIEDVTSILCKEQGDLRAQGMSLSTCVATITGTVPLTCITKARMDSH